MLKSALEVKDSPTTQDLYIDLLKKTLTMTLWDGKDGSYKRPASRSLAGRVKRLVRRMRAGAAPGSGEPESRRLDGRDWPLLAHTMIGLKRMENLQFCVESVLRDGVPGDLIETGVWRGGACIFMRGILKAHGVSDRRVWVADSFEGLPTPDAARYPADTGDRHHTFEPMAVSIEDVKSNFERYGLLDEQVCFLKGWFKDTLPRAPIERLALARLDGDMYESTMDALSTLYPKLSPGGFLLVDDYGAIRACRQAVDDYRRNHAIDEPIRQIDWTGIFWQRRNG